MKAYDVMNSIRTSVSPETVRLIQSSRLLSWAARSTAALLLMLGGRNQTIAKGPAAGVLLHLNPHITEKYLLGEYEPAIQEFIWSRLRRGDTMYDLGASIGFFSLLAAKRVGPSGKVYAFEPAPHAFDTMCRQIRANRFSWVVPFNQVLSDGPRKVSFAVTSNAYGSSIVDPGHTKWRKLEMLADNLDNIAKRESLAPPSLIKIDVENEEGRVVAGAIRLLSSARPTVICEIHSTASGLDVLGTLEGLGYRCRILGMDDRPAPEIIGELKSGQIHLIASHPDRK